jgi:hypothetical protein
VRNISVVIKQNDVLVDGISILKSDAIDFQLVVTDERFLTDTAQYQIGWHDGYRAQFNEANTKRHNDAEERMRKSATENNPSDRTIG